MQQNQRVFPSKTATECRSLRKVAEGEELQTNLLQVSQRGPASSSALDEVFGTHSLREHIEQCSGDLNVERRKQISQAGN
jgi:hypothetical protein